jgi:flagellar protein FliO/FliZ
MIGGPSDVVVEANIVRAAGAPREAPGTVRAPADALPRPVPLAEGNMWPLQPEPAPPPRPPRPAPSEQPVHWPTPQAAEPARVPQRPLNTLAGLADELSARPAPAREPPPTPRPEPPRAPASAPMPVEAAAAPPQGDQNLAEMAQRLEAALRRPAQPGRGKPAPAARPAPVAEEPPSGPPAQQHAPAPPAQAEAAAAVEAKPERSDAKSGKALYESLEQEMASLLGRQQQEKG